jgi:hypothetical protein
MIQAKYLCGRSVMVTCLATDGIDLRRARAHFESISKEGAAVFNLTVDGFHNYFVGERSVLCSNKDKSPN